MRRPSLIKAIKRRTAIVAVGPAAARNQGAPGAVAALREGLDRVPLKAFGIHDRVRYRRALDRATKSLAQELPKRSRSWGLARKCLNIFLRDCFYSADLRSHFHLARAEPFFEVPLDRVVARELRRKSNARQLPTWPGVKWLTPEISEQYQAAALELASEWGITRVHLDTYLWVEGRGR